MKFGQRINPDNILYEFFNQTDSLLLSKAMDLDNSNNVKIKLSNCKLAKFEKKERKKRNQPFLSTMPEGIFLFKIPFNVQKVEIFSSHTAVRREKTHDFCSEYINF